MKTKILFIACIFLLVLPIVNAVSVSPGKYELTFAPNFSYNFSFTFFNNMDFPMYVKFSISGDLAKYFELSKEKAYLEPGEGVKLIAYAKFPEEIQPGWHTVYVTGTEERPGEGTIAVRGAIRAIIKIFSQFHGKYILASVDAPDIKINETANIKVNIQNLGTEIINKLKAEIGIYKNDKLIDTIETNEFYNLEPLKKTTLNASWDSTGEKQGLYVAKATIYFDENLTEAEDSFRIGELDVKIINFTRTIYAGQINPFNIEIESKWNEPINNVYAMVKIKGDKEVSFITPTYSLKPWERRNITGYVNAEGLKKGIYQAYIKLFFADKFKEKYGNVTVLSAKIEKPKAFNYSLIVSLLILVIILLLIIVILLARRKNE